MIGIYKITSPSGKIYIGQSINIRKRFLKYNSLQNTKEQPALVRSFIKYGVINHVFEIIEICLVEELNIKERYWQDFYDVLNHGLNCVLTSTDILPRVISEKTKRKISLGNKGKKLSQESKDKISKNHARLNLGKSLSKETKLKLSIFNKGKKLSEETKLKMSNLECRKQKIIDIDSEIIYDSIKQVSEIFNIKLSRLRYFLQTKGRYENFKYYKK
jgi:group I intron endonuclease